MASGAFLCFPLKPTIPADFFHNTTPVALLIIKKILRLVVLKVKFKKLELNICLFESIQDKIFEFVNKIKLKL